MMDKMMDGVDSCNYCSWIASGPAAANCCAVESQIGLNYECTREEGHEGNHVACGAGAKYHSLEEWPQ